MSAAGGSNVGVSPPLGRVLVLDGWVRSALAVCRALGRLGCSVGVAGTDPRHNIAARSRYVSRHDTLPDPWGAAAPYEAALHELVEREGYAVVVAVHDGTLARLASIDLPIPTLSRLDDAWRILQDKGSLGEVCERAGVAYPRTERVESPEELAAAVERLGLPAFVKSSVSALARPDRVVFERKLRNYAPTREDTLAAAEPLWGELPVIIQREIDRGQKFSTVVIRRDGRSELRYVHRVLREYPRTGGMGISQESLDPESGEGAEVVQVLERVCDEVGYQGIVQAEIYRSTADDSLVVIDVNPRLWASAWFAERQGFRVIERSLRVALDLPPLPPPTPRPGMRFHDLSAELRWLMHEPSRWAGLRELVRTTRPRDHYEWVDLTDPMPMARYVADRIRKRLGREHAPDATWRPGRGGAPTRGARSGSR